MHRGLADRTISWFQKGQNLGLSVLITLFFLAMSVFWILKPIRKSLFISEFKESPLELLGYSLGGAQTEQLAKLSLVVFALLIAVILPKLVDRFSMRSVIAAVSFAGMLGLFATVLLVSSPTGTFVWSFYIFGDLINSLIVTLLWMLIHNSVSTVDAKKTYGAIGVGIVAGGVFGSFFLYSGVEALGRETIIAMSILPLAAVGVLGYKFACFSSRSKSGVNCSRPKAITVDVGSKEKNERESAAFSSGSLKYWAGIALLVGLYEVSSGIIDFQLSVAVENIESVGHERDIYFGLIGQIQSVLALVIQLFLTSWVMKRWGLGVALLILPFVTLLGSVGFLLIPTLVSAVILSVSDNALNYSVNQSAKETLYVPTKERERNKIKPLIDLFVQRFAKTFAILLNLILVTQVSLENVRWLSLLAIVIMISWIFIARITTKQFETLALDESRII